MAKQTITDWYDKLPESTKKYLASQPIWHDRDLYKALAIGIGIGLVVGFVLGWSYVTPVVRECFRPLIG